jgi:hypothetical protein
VRLAIEASLWDLQAPADRPRHSKSLQRTSPRFGVLPVHYSAECAAEPGRGASELLGSELRRQPGSPSSPEAVLDRNSLVPSLPRG